MGLATRAGWESRRALASGNRVEAGGNLWENALANLPRFANLGGPVSGMRG